MRKSKLGLIIILFMACTTALSGATVTFNAPDYAGSTFVFYKISNFILDKNEIIGEGTVDSNGTFKAELKVDRIMPVYSEFGVYKGWFICGPNDNYELTLPPKAEKTGTNPYFRPKLAQLGIKNVQPENVNFLIDNFNRVYNAELSKNMNMIFYKRSVETAETVIADLQGRFPVTGDAYFEQHKKYKYAAMKHMAMINSPEPIIEEYFNGQPILYYHPEYSTMFDKLFTKFLQYSTQQVDGQKTGIMINTGSYDQLIDWLTIDHKYDLSLSEAIILIGIKPLFYSKKFNSVGIYNILQRMMDKSQVPTHRETAKKLFNELARTMYGAVAPELSILDINGKMLTWENFQGKFVYVGFTRTDNEKFPVHKELIKSFHERFKDDLAFLIILEDDELEKNAALLKADGFEWTIGRGVTRREIFQDFNIRMTPTYFLIDPQGKMAGSQAAWPDENFDITFSNTLKATKE